MLNGLSLFTGIGGLDLALQEWVKPVLYCEIERYAQGVILSQISRGSLPYAPIWDDIRTLRGDDVGSIDIIYGGFPCQDLSAAGAGRGLAGERSGLFFEIERLVRETNPRFVFLENVPAIRTRGLNAVVQSFTELGYDCRWTIVSAAEVGAPHLRKRWFLLAHSNGESKKLGCPKERLKDIQLNGNGDTQPLEDTNGKGRGRPRPDDSREMQRIGAVDSLARPGWWATEPDVGGMVDELSRRLDRGGGLGDAEAEETGANNVLRELLNGPGAEAIQWATRGLDRLQAQEVLFSILREYEAGGWIPREFVASTATPESILREMRKNRRPPCPSFRRGSLEQYFGEYSDALRILSQLVASRSEEAENHPLWTSPVPRIANGVSNRVDRLRGLGNSVVWPQAKEAFERLMGLP